LDFSIQILHVVSVFLGVGLASNLLRKAAILLDQGKLAELSGAIRRSVEWIIFLGLPTSIMAILFRQDISYFFFQNSDFSEPLFWVALLFVPQGLIVLISGILNGVGKVFSSQLIVDVLKTVLVSVGILAFVVFNKTVDLKTASISYAIGGFLSLVYSVYLLRSYYTSKLVYAQSYAALYRDSLPFLFIFATGVLTTGMDSLMLGWQSNAEDVGVYSAVTKLAFVSTFFLTAGSASISPIISADYANGRYRKIVKQYFQMAFLMGSIAFVGLLVCIFFGRELLEFWGKDFSRGYTPLIILAVGQFVRLSSGTSSVILTYTGQEKVMGYLSVGTLITNAILNFFLIRAYGINGAAIATTLNLIFSNALIYYLVQKRTELDLFYWLPGRNLSKHK
jgi:O-antigen/teichoic acid export membrane protein